MAEQERQLLEIVSQIIGENKISAMIAGWMFFLVHLWGQIEITLGIRKERLSVDECHKSQDTKPEEEV